MADTILTPAADAAGDGTTAPETAPAAIEPASQAATTPPAPPADPTQQGSPETKEGEAKAAEAAPVEVKLPEGVTLDEGLLTAIKGGKPQEIADAYLAAQTKAEETRTSAWEQKQAGWVEALKADKDVGGQNWDASLKHAAKFMGRYASPELKQFLTDSGLGNHPELVRMAVAAGKALAEDTVAGTGGSPSAKPSQQEVLDTLYPTMRKQG